VYSIAITTYGLLFPSLWFAFKGTPIRMGIFLGEVMFPLLHTIVLFGLELSMHSLLKNSMPSFLLFLLSAAVGAFFYYFSWKIYPLGRKKIKDIEEVFNITLYKLAKMAPLLNRIFLSLKLITSK
ncbi:MAG: hypothetical protein ACRDE2_14950, partial [Chitinophagaceae bacterium]